MEQNLVELKIIFEMQTEVGLMTSECKSVYRLIDLDNEEMIAGIASVDTIDFLKFVKRRLKQAAGEGRSNDE